MPCIVRNDKGLCAGHSPALIIAGHELAELQSRLGALAEPIPDKDREILSRALSDLASLPYETSPAQAHRPPNKAMISLAGWNNAAQPLPLSAAAFDEQTRRLLSLARAKPDLLRLAHLLHGERSLGFALERVPSESSLLKIASHRVEPIGAESNAAPSEGYAIWMEQGQGWMDLKKRPSGLQSARLFESEAAAERTAKAAGFGDGARRGPAAIAQIALEPIEIVRRSPNAGIVAADGAISAREAALLASALALGDAFSLESAESLSSQGLASAEEGYAFWSRSPSEDDSPSGFLNKDQTRGPLSGAMLFDSEGRAASFGVGGYYRGEFEFAIAKVRARPVSVASRLGAAPAALVEASCSLERDRALREALAKAPPSSIPSRKSRSL